GCLAHASYLIGSEGEAAVVDPRRDVDEYLAEAQANGLRIRYVIETHLHADFVSGHRELAERTGAEVVFGKRAGAAFPHRPVGDGDELRLGAVVLRFLETPGHTPESVSILVVDGVASPQPKMVLTGDTLFIGDVGRPDLGGAPPRAGHPAPPVLSPEAVQAAAAAGATLLDVRGSAAYGAGHLPGSVNIGLGGSFASWAGTLLPPGRSIVVVAEDEAGVEEAVTRLARVGLDTVTGHLAGGVAAWDRAGLPLRVRPQITVDELAARRRENAGLQVVDVRRKGEYAAGHVPGARHVP